jgi:hypothetical protein
MLPSAERCGSTFDDQPQCSLVKTSQQKCQCAYQSGTTQHRVMSPFLQHPGKYRIRLSGFENRSSARSLNLLSMNESRVVRNHFQKRVLVRQTQVASKILIHNHILFEVIGSSFKMMCCRRCFVCSYHHGPIKRSRILCGRYSSAFKEDNDILDTAEFLPALSLFTGLKILKVRTGILDCSILK